MKPLSEATILVVDDQEVNRYTTGRILRAAAYNIVEAANGQEALVAAQSRPDLILLDVNLPDIDGFQVCREIRARPATAKIPVVHTSATFVSDDDKATGLELGADGYLTRPFEPRVLLATIRSCLRARRAEDQIGQRERELQLLADNSPDILSRFDRQFRHLFVSAAVRKIAGMSPSDMIGKSNRDLGMPAPLCDQWEAALKSAFETGSVQSIDFAFDTPERTWYFSARLVPEFDADGKVVNVLGITHDVTERRRAEIAIQQSELRFRTMANSISQLAWMAQPDGRIVWYNDRWLLYTGMTQQQLQESGWDAALDAAERRRVLEKAKANFNAGTPWEDTCHLRRHDGESRCFLSRVQPARDETGKIVLWFGTNTDIEDLRRTEAERHKFVSLVECSSDFIAIYDLQGAPLFINRAGLALIGLDNFATARAVPLKDYVLAEDQVGAATTYLTELKTKGHVKFEIQIRNIKDGTIRWMNCNVFAVKDENDMPIAYATVSRDTTEQKGLDNSLRQVAADLSEAYRRQNEFLATLAHELRNPLAPIRTGLEIMRHLIKNSSETEEVRSMMERQTQQLVRLVDDLLDLSRIRQDKLNLRTATVVLADVINNAVESVRPLVDRGNHDLVLDSPEDPIFVDADPSRLSQVFSNILSNAAKYTPRGGRITLRVQRFGDEVSISIQDNGLGIPKEMQSRIFEMFAQIERPQESEYTGLGIGLTLVRRIIALHGGTISVFSQGANQGSEFVVRLPALPREHHITAGARPADVAPSAGQRILVADDNQDAANSLSTILRMLGHEVQTAFDGLEAVRMAKAFGPAIVLMDLGMPVLSGFEAARKIREHEWGREMVLIALTGWGQEDDKARTRNAGFDVHLTKPVEPSALQSLLQKYSVHG